MRFVTVRHEGLDRTARVPESRVPHLSKGWTVVEAQPDTNPAVDDAPVYQPAADSGEETPPTHHRAGRGSRQKES